MFVRETPVADDSDYAVEVRAHAGQEIARQEASRRGIKGFADFTRESAKKGSEVSVAGVLVMAADTGRVLLLQRSFADQEDPARGKWEAPGGHIEDGETPWQGAMREWCEETGHEFPNGSLVEHWTSNGIYEMFLYRVASEDSVQINLDHEDRHTINPDDPDGDDTESMAWWTIQDIADNPSMRKEFRAGLRWQMLKRESEVRAP